MAFPSNPIYKLVNHPITGELVNIRTATDDFIPIAEDNTMYQEYLEWVAEGNTAEAAD
jgi:EAL domain-containing protein (putative c-di-GMP-specific phosphodiesterase class I)